MSQKIVLDAIQLQRNQRKICYAFIRKLLGSPLEFPNGPVENLVLLSVFSTSSPFEIYQCTFVHPELHSYSMWELLDNPKYFLEDALHSGVVLTIIHVK